MKMNRSKFFLLLIATRSTKNRTFWPGHVRSSSRGRRVLGRRSGLCLGPRGGGWPRKRGPTEALHVRPHLGHHGPQAAVLLLQAGDQLRPYWTWGPENTLPGTDSTARVKGGHCRVPSGCGTVSYYTPMEVA